MGAPARTPRVRHDDAPLIALARTDPRAAFDALYRRWSGPLLGFMISRCPGDRQRAEDLCQTAWLKAWRTLPTYEHAGQQYLAYLVTIALNLLRDEVKGAHMRRCVVVDPLPPVDTEHTNASRWLEVYTPPESSAEDEVLSAERERILAGVGPALAEEGALGSSNQQAAIRLQYFENLPVAAIADRLDLNVGAVKALTHRGRTTLARSATIRRIYSELTN